MIEDSIAALLEQAGDQKISQLAEKWQAAEDKTDIESERQRMASYLGIMRESVAEGMNAQRRSLSGLTGGQASRMAEAVREHKTAGGSLLGRAAARAMAVAECNAAMGRIVAAPTAGSCGILPAALLTAQEEYNLTDEQLTDALFTASLFGQVIARRASISGAAGGCQAECGSASAMAAAALVELRGGTADMCAQACAFALMNTMGLVCDPVAGLVEIPCVYRNVGGIANAFSAADMALSGLRSPIPTDEVIDAMQSVGDQMPACLRETGEGGVAATPAAREIAQRILGADTAHFQ